MHDSFLTNIWGHASIFLSGATAVGIVAHAVNTFPTPRSPFGAWLLGVVQFAVGQRVAAGNTFKGQDTQSIAIPKSKDDA